MWSLRRRLKQKIRTAEVLLMLTVTTRAKACPVLHTVTAGSLDFGISIARIKNSSSGSLYLSHEVRIIWGSHRNLRCFRFNWVRVEFPRSRNQEPRFGNSTTALARERLGGDS